MKAEGPPLKAEGSSLNTKLSLFWFAYFAGLGVFFPFFGLFLEQELEMSPSEVGWVLAAIPWVGLIAQPLWGRAADRRGSRRMTLGICLCGTAVAYAALGLLPAFWPVFLGTVVLATFSTVVVPMGTAVSLASLAATPSPGGGGSRFGLVRVWGTVGFLVAVLCLPYALEQLRVSGLGPWQGLGWLFPLVALCTLAAVPWILQLPSSFGLGVRSEPGDTRRLIRHSPVARLLVFLFFAHLCVQAPIQLFPLLITDRGGNAAWISQMWVLMLLVEIPLIGFVGPSLRRVGARGLLTLGMLSEGFRWIATALITDFSIFRWVQLLHGVGVAGFFVGSAIYLEEAAPERSRATCQSLAATVAGLGTILSLAGGGWIFERFGADAPYLLAGVGSLALGLIASRWLPPPRRPPLDYT